MTLGANEEIYSPGDRIMSINGHVWALYVDGAENVFGLNIGAFLLYWRDSCILVEKTQIIRIHEVCILIRPCNAFLIKSIKGLLFNSLGFKPRGGY